jgi:hypothetical protein
VASLRVFLSYAKEDLDRVRAIYSELVEHGLDVWMDEVRLRAGQDWELEVTKAIRDSHFFVACLSTKAVTKEGFVQKELKKALDILDEMPEGRSYVIPVRLEPCDVPSPLQRLHYCDLFKSGSPPHLIRDLLKEALERGLDAEVTEVLSHPRWMAGRRRKAGRIVFHCSFCGKNQDQVGRLIAGPGAVYICNECVELCMEIVTEEGIERPPQ